MNFVITWPLYISIFVFVSNVYLSVGVITSLGLLASVVGATVIGRMADTGKGLWLYKRAVVLQSLGHAVRSLVTSPLAVISFNTVADLNSIAVRMPYTKGLYAAASSYEGYRNAYMATIMASSNIVRSLYFVLMFALLQLVTDQQALQLLFVAGVPITLIALTQNFKALK